MSTVALLKAAPNGESPSYSAIGAVIIEQPPNGMHIVHPPKLAREGYV